MLVVISDLHLTDGSSGETIKAGAFARFADELRWLAAQASQRQDGQCLAVDGVDVLLLGDILDVIRSSRWLQSSLRPWDDPARIAAVVDDITAATLQHNAAAIGHLRALQQDLGVDVGGARVPVPLRLHFMVGNHDWFFHLPGVAYDAIRRRVVDAFGLHPATHGDAGPFLHSLDDITVSGRLLKADDDPRVAPLRQLLRRHGVVARRGDIFDAFNFDAEKGRDASSLGDCMVIELLNRFPHDVADALGLPPDDRLIVGLKEIDNVRPLLMIPTWLLGVLQRERRPGLKDAVMQVWRRRVRDFLDHPFVRSLDRPFRFDLVDGLALALTLSGNTTVLELAAELPAWMQPLLLGSDSYAKQSLDETAIKDGSADFAVYGHTHHAEVVPLAAVDDGASDRGEQLELNAGTWRCVHERCIGRGQSLAFSASHVMTWLTFYGPGERKGRRYETWSGRLDVKRASAPT